MMIKEATVSVLAFRQGEAGERQLGLAFHERLGGWLYPGGHVEVDESPAEAAVRETAEELGCLVRLLPGPSLPLPAGYPHGQVPAPWWTVEMPAAPDRHTPELHVHVDHVYVGLYVADDRVPETRVWWAREREIAEALDVPEDVRLPAKELFAAATFALQPLAGPAALA
jgi:8-oxo-dGTP pyrophosphatase MutT (NUDIX family)